MIKCTKHKKVYQKPSRTIFIPSHNWICKDCMETGSDENEDYNPEPSYEELMQNKNKFLVENL